MNPRLRMDLYLGKPIYIHDYRGLAGKELLKTIPELVSEALRLKVREQLIVLDVTDAKANAEIVNAFKKAAVDIAPVVKKMAITGITPLQKVFLSGVNMFSNLGITPFDTMDEAKEWLVKG